jgi:hypothetical protein
MSEAAGRIRVTVACGDARTQQLVALELPAGATVADALRACPFAAQGSEQLDVGIFNRPCGPQTPLRDGDRVEIYRPLTIDPKEARRVRAEVRRRRREK